MAHSDPNDKKKNKDFIYRSNLYQEFLAEREEILRHKWIESEKAGTDVGFERALLDWIRNHRDQWREERRKGRLQEQHKGGSATNAPQQAD